jgi:cytochrome P450
MTMQNATATHQDLAPPRASEDRAVMAPEAPPADLVKVSLDPHVSYEAYAEMRAKGPVVHVSFSIEGVSGEAGGQAAEFREFMGRDHIFVTRYEQVIAALLDNRFSANPRSAMTPEQQKKLPPTSEELRPLQQSVLTADPPDHTRLRKLVQPSFSARAMEALRPRVQQIADELLDKAEKSAADRGQAPPDRAMDLIEAFAYPLPVTVISEMLGIPREDRDQVRLWTEDLLHLNRRGTEESRAKLRQFTAYLRDLFAAKRKSPTDDMTSQLIRAEEDGDKLNEDEVLAMVFILFIAGHVTTVNLIGNGASGLLRHPAELAKLKADLSLAKGVVEETLRCWGPVDFISRRIAKEDLDISGTPIPKGEPIMVGLASANRDPERFANPDAFDITRADADRHVAFGKGIHLCVGAPLARMEGQIAFETLFRRLPDLRLAVPSEEVRWGSSFLRGIEKLPVLF